MNEFHRPTRRVCRVQPDDPRIESVTRWLSTCTLTPATQAKVRVAILETILASGEWDAVEEVPEGEVEAEVRQPAVAAEVPRRPVRETQVVADDLWSLWVSHYGINGARALCAQADLVPLE